MATRSPTSTPKPRATMAHLPTETLVFLDDLAQHNNRRWFEENRLRYENDYQEPARALIVALGAGLHQTFPGLVADPRTDRSLFRLHRDVRFSKNKDPYKTHLAIVIWEGDNKALSPCFYLQVSPTTMFLGAGLYQFDPPTLRRYREVVGNTSAGDELAAIVSKLPVPASGQHFARVPRGFAPDHPHGVLLRHSGLFAGQDFSPPPDVLHTDDCVPWMLEQLAPFYSLHHWLVTHLLEPEG